MKYLAGMITIGFLSGCSLLSPVQIQENQYVLGEIPPLKHPPAEHLVLQVARPNASPVFDTAQMAYSVRKWEISHFAKNRWAAPLPDMLEGLLVETLQPDIFPADTAAPVLHTDILAFQADMTGLLPVFRIRLAVRLVSVSGKVIAMQQFSVSEPMIQVTPYGAVVAANRAISKILAQTAVFCRASLP